MAAKQANVTTSYSNLSTSDRLIFEVLNSQQPAGLSTGEKVTIGFGIAGGAIVIGYFIYKGIVYLVTKHKEKKGYAAIQLNPNASVPENVPEVNPNQYNINMSQQPVYTERVITTDGNVADVPVQPVQQQPQQSQINPNQFITREEFNQIVGYMNTMSNTITEFANNVNAYIQNTDNKINELSGGLTKMVDTMAIMGDNIKERNNQEYTNMQNAVNAAQQQAVQANIARERAEAEANHMMGMHDQMASQIGAPMYNQIPRDYFQRTAPVLDKYPNLTNV